MHVWCVAHAEARPLVDGATRCWPWQAQLPYNNLSRECKDTAFSNTGAYNVEPQLHSGNECIRGGGGIMSVVPLLVGDHHSGCVTIFEGHESWCVLPGTR